MAYKRRIDRLPIIPADAKEHNVTCHYCIVGCGYKAYTWPMNKQGGTAPDQNKFGVDLSQQQDAMTTSWYAPSMYNVVKQDGKDVHLVIKPDGDCVVNSGLGSVRGARMAENRRSDVTGSQQQRLTEPMVWRYGTWQPTSWDDALDLVARVTARVIDKDKEDDLFVSMFDHGGSAGGYENTWGTGKLYFGAMKVKHCRIHNRPAYNSEVHSTRDMGVGELNYAYEDYGLTDTIFLIGANSIETQTNLFLNHMLPGMQNGAKVVVVDPRRTVTINACEEAAGAANVLHLQINSGTDLALFNALFTEIVAKGWTDSEFIKASTFQGDVAVPEDSAHPAALGSFDAAVAACKVSLDEAATICGVKAEDIAKAAAWIAEPKDGARRKCVTAYEKGIIWGNDNYRTVGALVNIGLATGNIGREGGGVCRLGGHQEGYMRPSDAHVGRPAPYIDQLIIAGQGKVHHIWANDHYKTTLNAAEFKRVYNRRTNMVKEAMDARSGATREELVDAIVSAIDAGGLFTVDVDIIHSQIGQAAHVILPAVESGEMNLTSMNGERRMRLVEKYMDGPGSSKPDCMIAAGIAQTLEKVLRDEGRTEYADQFKGFDWASEEDAFMDGYHANTGKIVTYDRLRAMGNNGVQEPVTGYEGDKLVGTKRLYADGKFDRHGREDKLALFCLGVWRGLQAPGKEQQKASFKFLINNGRSNINWQNWFLDQKNDFVMDRFPVPFIQIHPDDMASIGLKPGDMVEVYNDVGATQALAYPEPTARAGETFMIFGAPSGTQGNVVNAGVNELILPNYKQTWANIRKISDATPAAQRVSYKSWEVQL
ncbi:MAG: arsenate reductase (azurin) large subunit [Cypionkella sp.]